MDLTATPEPDGLWQGRIIGHYRLSREIGRGSMASVYRAEDLSLQRTVALKIFSRRSRGDERLPDLRRLIDEARSSAALDHENIVRVYEIAHDSDWAYIAMEFVAGSDLETLVDAAGPIDARRACLVGAELAQALAYAHQMGIIHRDVKPANLILSRSGQCKITDFGLAERLDDAVGDSLACHAVGTPHYLAPEVARGKPATPASDVYSLGATLWHLLSGRPLFEAPNNAALLMKHIQEPVPDLTHLCPNVGSDLARVIERCVAKRPQERWPPDQLARVLWSLTIPSSASTAITPSLSLASLEGTDQRRHVRLQSFMPLFATAIGLLIAIGAIYAAAVSWTHPSQREREMQSRLTQPSVPVTVPAPEVTGATSTATVGSMLALAKSAFPSATEYVAASATDRLKAIAGEKNADVVIYGHITSAGVTSTGRSYRLRFDGTPADGFYAVAFPPRFAELQARFGEQGSLLDGQVVAISGPLTLYDGCPQVKILDADQLRVLPEHAAAWEGRDP